MADTNNVFISWSGERSKRAAEALREWLGTVLQNARPWMSDTDIEKGSRSFDEIARALEGMKIGIICLTPENLTSEWLHYEAGALSKTMDPKTRVCTYLLANLESATLKPPLSWFQWTKANKSDTRKLIGTINNHLDATPVLENRLDTIFDKMWPDLDQKLKALPAPSSAPPPRRSTDEMVAEILELSRVMAPEIMEIKDEIDYTRRRIFFGEPLRSVFTGFAALERGLSGEKMSLADLARATSGLAEPIGTPIAPPVATGVRLGTPRAPKVTPPKDEK
jgi:hypothetical protein